MTFSVKVDFKNNFDEKRPDLLFLWLFWEVSFEGVWDEEKYVFVKMDNSLILAPLTWEKKYGTQLLTFKFGHKIWQNILIKF